MSSMKIASLTLLGLALMAGCTVVASYPDTRPENDRPSCQDGRDNDLNGDMDCADTDCAGLGVCPEADQVLSAALTPCFKDDELGVEFESDGEICEPWPDGTEECAPGMVRFPGRGACEELAPPCAEDDDFADGIAAELFVAAEGTGDGSRGAPFGALEDALAVAPAGSTIALAEGMTATASTLARDVTLLGCGAGSTLTSNITIEAAVMLRGVHVIAPSGEAAITVTEVGALSLRGSRVRSESVALVVAGHADVEVAALEAPTAARVLSGDLLARVAVFTGGVEVLEGASAELRASAVTDSPSIGLRVDAGATVILRGVILERSGTAAARVACGLTTTPCLDVEDLVVRESGTGAGLMITNSNVQLTRALVEGAAERGIEFIGSIAQLDHVVVRNTRNVETGVGLFVGSGSNIRASHVRLRANLFRGLVVDSGTVLFSELQILGEQESGTGGIGLLVKNGGDAVLIGFVINEAGLCGVTLEEDAGFSGNRGVISENVRGVCIQGAEITVQELTESITYSGNSRNILDG